jgi:hypothetical protein
MEQLRIASPTPRLDTEQRTNNCAPTVVRYDDLGCGGRDRNRRCGHSRSLESWHVNQDGEAGQLSTLKEQRREVLADDSYRGHRASVQKVARNVVSICY